MVFRETDESRIIKENKQLRAAVTTYGGEVKKLKCEISDLKDLLKKNEDKNVRLLAEFDNYKKEKL